MIELEMGKGKICFDFSFFAVIGFYTLFGGIYPVFSIIAAIIHECSHILAMIYQRRKIDCILFYGGGIKLLCNMNSVSVSVLAAGCCGNFIVAFIFFMAYEQNLDCVIFAISNLLIGCYNLLPLGFLDGKNILLKICEKKGWSDLWVEKAEKCTLVMLILAYLWALFYGFLNISLIIVLVYMFMVEMTVRK